MADGSVACSACGDVVAAHRLGNHEQHWCSARAGASDDEDSDNDARGSSEDNSPEQMQRVREMIAGVRPTDASIDVSIEVEAAASEPEPEPEPKLEAAAGPSAARVAGWGSRLQSMATVTLTDGLTLQFEQQSVFGDTSTGGALWRAELLLAEWCIRELKGKPPATALAPRRVLELGCGVAPAAGLACVALGCDVVLTDLGKVLPLLEANLRLNAMALAAARASCYASPLSRASCDTAEVTYHPFLLSPPATSLCASSETSHLT